MSASAARKTHPAQILVVEDHPFVREGIVRLIERQSDLCCCGEADSIETTAVALTVQTPDLVLLDLRLKDGDGFSLLKLIKSQFPGLPVLILSQFDEKVYARSALEAGAQGYLTKEEAAAEVLTAIRAVLKGEIYVSRAMSARLLRKLEPDGTQFDGTPLHQLSRRELQVFQSVGAGMSTREIADSLGISVKTVETHREHLKLKLGMRDANDLIQYATNWVHGRASTLAARE